MLKELKLKIPRYYKVKEGQTLKEIAQTFSMPPLVLIRVNGLKEELCGGEILKIPDAKGNLYTVQVGDTKTLLAGSEEAFAEKNLTELLYPGMKVFL